MATELDAVVREKSTAVIQVTFRNEDGVLIIPKTALWSLTTVSGAVINSRSKIPIPDLATNVSVVLSGDDLKMLRGKKIQDRIFSVEGTYDSALGIDLPFTGACAFQVENLAGV